MWNDRFANSILFALVLAGMIVLSSCAAKHAPLCEAKRPSSVDRRHSLDCPKPDERLVPRPDNCHFDWQHQGPLEFLACLETSEGGQGPATCFVEPDTGACFVTCKHVGWIKRNDVPALIDLLDCKTHCRDVLLSTMLWDSGGASKLDYCLEIDYQALVMLESYQAGYYPSFDKTGESFSQRREEFLKWWKQQK